MANSPKGIVDYTNKLNETFARQDAVASVFDATTTYAVGESVMYNGKRYTFNTAHSAGAWDPTEVDEGSVQDDVDGIVDTMRQNGAHNLLPASSLARLKQLNVSGTWSNNIYTPTGESITFTVNGDGTVSASGSATNDVSFKIWQDSQMKYTNFNNMLLNGCVGGSENTYMLRLQRTLSPYTQYATQTDDDATISGIPYEDYAMMLRIIVKAGASVNKTFYPMIRQASDTDKTYAPYAMTNKELAVEKAGVLREVARGTAGGTYKSQLNEIFSAFDALSLIEKMNSKLYIASHIYNNSIIDGRFSNAFNTSTDDISVECLWTRKNSNSSAGYVKITPAGVVTNVNETNSTCSDPIILYTHS